MNLSRFNWSVFRQRLKRIWIATGLTLTVVFVGWSLIAFRATSVARDAQRSDAAVSIELSAGERRFTPTGLHTERTGMIFFPGGMVDPTAYAPLARAVASAGFPVVILDLPRRGAFGGADDPELLERARSILARRDGPIRWVVAGHSRGAVVAAQLASETPRALAGLVLIGTTHPRDIDLSNLTLPVTKLVATRDGLARLRAVEANAHLLPTNTRWVRIEGGNHSQFGWYGFQPGDRFARITADTQRAIMIGAVIESLRSSIALSREAPSGNRQGRQD